LRALVIGGAGFIGSSLVERLLAESWHVEVVDDLSTGSLDRLASARAGAAHTLRIHRHDISDSTTADLVERAAPDRVFFLADALGGPDPVRRIEVGVVGLVRVLEGARRLVEPPKVIKTVAAGDLHSTESTSAAVAEDVEPTATSPGTVAAVSAIAALRAYRTGSSVEHTVLVLADVYGPSMPVRGDLGIALGAAVAGVGRLVDRGFDLIHLDDTVDALVRAASRGDGLVVNVSSGGVVPAAEVVAALTGLGATVELGGSPAGPTVPPLDNGRAQIHLGWTPFTPLGTGLGSTVTV